MRRASRRRPPSSQRRSNSSRKVSTAAKGESDMAAVTTTRQAPVLPPPSGRAGFGGTLRSEFTKIRSVRSTYWTLLVLLAIIVGIGAIVLTAEYSTGMIRTSLTALPRRVTVYAAKALVFAIVALVVTLVAAFIAFFLGQALLA